MSSVSSLDSSRRSCSLVTSFIYSFIHSFIHSFTHSINVCMHAAIAPRLMLSIDPADIDEDEVIPTFKLHVLGNESKASSSSSSSSSSSYSLSSSSATTGDDEVDDGMAVERPAYTAANQSVDKVTAAMLCFCFCMISQCPATDRPLASL
jgi:hypothetical protein